ncbi:MAG TPA: tetratricopeptide repeat protein, partial [Solirubrobacteraceae bacterium]
RGDTGGNPFFALELLRSRGEGDDEAAPTPHGVRDVIRRRVERLGGDTASALTAAAVAGQEFDPGLVAAIAGRPEDGAAAALDAAARARLLVELPGPGARFRFSHALLERSLTEELGASARRRLHRRAAEALDARGGGARRALEVARHWYEAEPPDLARALATAQAAGEVLLEQRDPQAAATWFERALELHDRAGGGEDAVRCDLLIGLGRALSGQGDARFRETLLQASRMAQRLGERDRLVRAALANGRGFASAGGETDEERIAVLGAAIEAVGPGDSAERAALLATLANELYFSPPDRARRIALSDEALAMARRVGDPATLARVLTGRITIWAPDTTEQVVRDMEENVAVADVLGDPLAQFRALRWLGACLLEAGRVAEAERATARATQLAERLGDPTARWLSVQDQANLAIVHGRLEEAERLAERALALGTESGQPDALPFYANQVTMLRWEQGRLPELQELLAQVVANTPGVPAFRAALALAYAEADLHREARAVLAMDSASGFEELPMDIMWLFGHVLYAHVAADAGMTAAAGQLFERLAPWAGRIVWNTAAWGSVDLALGRLALALDRPEEAGRRLAEARTRAEAWGAPVWRARALVEQARLALAGDAPPEERDRAAGLLEEAAGEARRLGAESVRRRAEALLGRERAARTLAASPAGLRLGFRTPGEEPPAGVAAPPVAAANGPRPVELRREGQMWTLTVDGRDLRFEDNKGIRYLARLLAAPGIDVHVVDLQSGTEPAGAGAPAHGGDANPAAVLDPQAREAYRERLAALDEEIEEAERFNDVERLARARQEREFIGRELALAVGLGGRERRLGDPAERARINVTRALRRMIGRIEASDPVLGHHLRSSVRTGAFCVYDPAPSDRLDWRLER